MRRRCWSPLRFCSPRIGEHCIGGFLFWLVTVPLPWTALFLSPACPTPFLPGATPGVLPFLTSFYGNGGTKFPKNSWTAIVHNFVTPNRLGRGSERVKTAGAPLRRECEACSVPTVDAADFDKLGESEKRILDYKGIVLHCTRGNSMS